MGEEVAISLKNISKCYKRYARPVDRLKEILLPGKSYAQDFWALKDINLEINQGETVGIIGQNGSGKSTLLQVIARTLTPTTGEVFVNGRVSALLELGSGFNPEFTGRQNVFFNGRILGLSKEEIAAKYDDIAAFAEIGEFIDQPVKTYSSGMFVRLAFAVAVNVNPEILIVDEALAVGDIFFQQKCFEAIKNLKDLGTSLLFVSHDSTAVYKLCQRALLIETGQILLDSKPKTVIDLYEAKLLKQKDVESEKIEVQMFSDLNNEIIKNQNSSTISTDLKEVSINVSDVYVEYVKFLDIKNKEVDVLISEHTLKIIVGLSFLKCFEDPHIGFKIRDIKGEVIFETNTYCMKESIGKVEENDFYEFCFEFQIPILAGEYSISIGVSEIGYGEGSFKRTLVYSHNVAKLKILSNKDSILWSGIVNLKPSFYKRKVSV
ncbi:ABC-type polysaccharide/polyol phosphate transport system, ATPase component [Rivularia sp. PCC 7116]|uniref:ABC transporter ATP-binding protein n=1 Tax=Rivularia sp. PCC 7116 TaxID=373994 RepID=UPI00029ECC4C|nr:ABC transporter ATP-binding protein [Rivularia sp. PCC 7116]AFY58270.1 ABC-type polysaccharide/polyol phosphate transport system, ATPase component [Rivularia sp. PCC 7116]